VSIIRHIFYYRIPFTIFIEDIQTLIDTERKRREATDNFANFDYFTYHSFEEVSQSLDVCVLTCSDQSQC